MPDYNQTPQFNTAQFSAAPSSTAGPDRCFSCTQPVGSQYYRVNGKTACSACADRLRQAKPNTHAAFVRGLTFGVGAALIGLILYATFTIVTHLYLGYVALGVGWMVGKAIMLGSGGVGGRRFQIAAVLLTYGAISFAEIPILIYLSSISFGSDLGRLLWIGLASPFLDLSDPVHGVIGLVILFVGIRIAWKMTQDDGHLSQIDGPYNTSAASV